MEKLLDAGTVADILGVPLTTLYAWRTRGGGPPGMRVGRFLRYRREDVEAWLQAQQAKSA